MSYKDAILDTSEFTEMLVELYREQKERSKNLDNSKAQWVFTMPLDTYEYLRAWLDATEGMGEEEYKAYFESVYGAGSWDEDINN